MRRTRPPTPQNFPRVSLECLDVRHRRSGTSDDHSGRREDKQHPSRDAAGKIATYTSLCGARSATGVPRGRSWRDSNCGNSSTKITDSPRHRTRPRRGHGHLAVFGAVWRRSDAKNRVPEDVRWPRTPRAPMETTRPAQAAWRSHGRCNSMVGRVDKERVDQKHVRELFFVFFRSVRKFKFPAVIHD